MPGTTEGKLTQKIFMGKGLLEILIRRCQSDSSKELLLSLDEARLIARAFSALPAEILCQVNIHVFDKESAMAHEMRLQEETEAQGRRLPYNRGENMKVGSQLDINLMSIFKALANLVTHNEGDSEVAYFSLYSVFNIVNTVNLLSPTVNGKSTMSKGVSTKGPVDLTELKLQDLDYEMLTSCLIRSNILKLVLI